MAAAHQAKRSYAGPHSQTNPQHQSVITSYFPSSFFPSTIRHDIHTNTTISSPELPALVQSNLLSVGMRVRKSVPEGYKTGSSKSHNSYSGSGSSIGVAAGRPSQSASTTAPPAATKTPASTRRELTPFCGIMKVGGMAVQGWDADADVDGDGEVPAEDDIPFLNSQGSTISAISTDSRTSYKRRFDDEDEDEEPEPEKVVYDIWRDADDDVQLSPKTRPVDLMSRSELGLGSGRRAMAVPKSRRKGGSGVKGGVLEGQENDNLSVGVLQVDFGEAEFMDWSSCLG